MIFPSLKKWFPDLSNESIDHFELFAKELVRYNKALSLIPFATSDSIEKVHFADCINGFNLILKHQGITEPVYDLGSGNGFPGLVIGMYNPTIEVFLVEKDVRKCDFLKHVIALTKITNVLVLNTQIEKIAPATISLAVSRGLASLNRTLVTYRHIFKNGANYYSYKSDSWPIELADMPTQIFAIWKPSLVGNYRITGTDKDNAVVVAHKLAA